MSWQDTFTPSTPPDRSGSSARTPGGPAGAGGGEAEQPVVRDKRRIDPETGQVRQPAVPEAGAQESSAPEPAGAAGSDTTGPTGPTGPTGLGEPDAASESAREPAAAGEANDLSAELAAAAVLAQERLEDVQRLQAEYVNYRRRVERDRDVAREAGVVAVLEALLPALDDIALARQHGDLDGGPFAAIAEKLEAALARVGLVSYGQVGEEFDPAVHEALLHSEGSDVAVTTVTTVLQSGYRTATRVLRPARVAVTSPA